MKNALQLVELLKTPVAMSRDLSRRDLVKVAAGTAGLVLTSCRSKSRLEDPLVSPLADPLYNSSAKSLAAAILEKQISSVELMDAYLTRIEEVNPALNAVVQLRADGARAEAKRADAALAHGKSIGPLHGVPMTIKDSLDTAGVVSTGGTLGRSEFVPNQDATVVQRLKAAGAILLGKTNTPEFTMSGDTHNLIYGRTNNPWDITRTPGGSSGGAAAIVASGGSSFDIGSDYGGSIRIPAHFCGIAGLKPSHGRVPRTGHILPYGGITDSFQQLGPLARNAEDLFIILEVIAGPDNIDPAIVPMPLGDPAAIDLTSLRVGFHTDNGIRTPTPETQEVVRAAALALDDLGARVDESRPNGIEQSFEIAEPIYEADGGAGLRRLLRAAGTTTVSFAPGITSPSEWAQPEPSAEELDQAMAAWYTLRSQMSAYWVNHDVIICPANAFPAGSHGMWDDPEMEGAYSYTQTYNLTGWPAGVVRGGISPEGLPIAVQVVAAPGREDLVLAVLIHLEEVLGGFRPPPI